MQSFILTIFHTSLIEERKRSILQWIPSSQTWIITETTESDSNVCLTTFIYHSQAPNIIKVIENLQEDLYYKLRVPVRYCAHSRLKNQSRCSTSVPLFHDDTFQNAIGTKSAGELIGFYGTW